MTTISNDLNTNDLNVNELNEDDINDVIYDVTQKKKVINKVTEQQKKNNNADENIKKDNNIIQNDKTIKMTNNKIKITINDIDDLDNTVDTDPEKKLLLKEQENKILSGEVYNHINDKYYHDLSNYNINKHGIGNSPIITDVKNTNKHRQLTNQYISNFYGYDYKHLCHPDNSLYDFEILKNLSNDYEFQYDYRNIGYYDDVINKYLHTNLIHFDKHKKNLIKIILILKKDMVRFDNKKLIIYYNEWLLNNNWMILNDDKIITKFINAYNDFIHKYDLLFNKKIYYEQKKVNTTDFNVSTSSIFYESNLNESKSLKNNNTSFNHLNKMYYNNRPSTKYNKASIIPFSYSSVF